MFSNFISPHLELVPQLNEVYELEIAFYESNILSDEEIIRNGAYFARVGDIFTRHYLICKGEPLKLAQHSSSRLKSFFKTNQFKTGYATHGLFPYRGKFHPQMIKGIINIMGLKPCDTVLDPMMGSGTVLIEASLMGIKSIGVDSSPFCQFMTKAKIDGLRVDLKPIKYALDNYDAVFKYFSENVGYSKLSNNTKKNHQIGLFKNSRINIKTNRKSELPDGFDIPEVQNFMKLSYLDAVGYSERSQRKSLYEQFQSILERYYFVAGKIQSVFKGLEHELADAKSLCGDARNLPVEDDRIDGVIFSPPYSFAIDYLDNDAFHLNYLGISLDSLRESMIGLRGKTLKEKYNLYVEDMKKVLAECSRVLKKGKICSIVVGTNNNQLSKIFNVAPEHVKGIDQILVELGEEVGFSLIRRIERQITGMANTMRSEYIVMLEKV